MFANGRRDKVCMYVIFNCTGKKSSTCKLEYVNTCRFARSLFRRRVRTQMLEEKSINVFCVASLEWHVLFFDRQFNSRQKTVASKTSDFDDIFFSFILHTRVFPIRGSFSFVYTNCTYKSILQKFYFCIIKAVKYVYLLVISLKSN